MACARWFSIVVLAGCATTRSICPAGTKLVDLRERDRRAQWCASTVRPPLPMAGHAASTYEDALGITQPIGFSGGVEGPFSTWHPDGTLAARGAYVDLGARSVPDGIWRFWYRDGKLRTIGTYRRGAPVGCFAVWDERGMRSTGVVEGDRLRVEPCTPPDVGVEDHEIERRVRGDVSVQTFFGVGGIGARNAEQLDADPALRAGFIASARVRLHHIRFGATGAVRISDNTGYQSLAFGGVVALPLPTFHPRLDPELAVDLGIQNISATARRPRDEQPGTADLTFWEPLVGAQLGIGFALSESLELLGAVRVDGSVSGQAPRRVTYCDFAACYVPRQEVWETGGFAYGASIGLRVLL